MHVNAVSISASVSVYLSASAVSATVSVSVDVFSAVFATSLAHLDTFRFISSNKMCRISGPEERDELEELQGIYCCCCCCEVVSLLNYPICASIGILMRK